MQQRPTHDDPDTVDGLIALPRSRQGAYRWFKRSTLVWIFFGQVFLFYTQQFGALVELVLSLIALAGLDALLTAERRAQRLADHRKDVTAGV